MGGAGVLYVAAVVAWVAVAYKALPLRWPRENVSVTYWLILLFSALAVTALLPPIYLALDRLTGIPNLARLLANGSTLIASWLVQLSIWRLNYPEREQMPRVRSSGLVMLAFLVILAGLFVIAPIGGEEAGDFTGRYVQEPTVQLYRGVFLGYLAFTAIEFIRLSWRYIGRVTLPILILSEYLLILGAALGFAYTANELSRIACSLIGVTYPLPAAAQATRALLSGGLILMIVGSTLPTWGRYFGADRLARKLAMYHTYRRLYPLWRAIYHAFPHVILAVPRWDSPIADALTVDLRFLFYRRVIEIRDGYVALRGYRDRRAAYYAAAQCRRVGVPDDEAALVVEAAEMAAALRAYTLHREPDENGEPLPIAGGDTFGDDAAHLAVVSQRFRRSSIIYATLAQLDDEDGIVESSARDDTPDPGSSVTILRRLARIVTEVLAPAPTVAVLLALVVWHSTTSPSDALKWGVLVLIFVPILPLLYLLYEVRRQRLTDLHVRLREQRPRILAVAIASIVVLLGLLIALGAPRELLALIVAGVVGLVSVTLVTLVWKISIHVTVVSGSVVTLIVIFGWPLLILVPIIALTAWSRVTLRDHTPGQVLTGALLGAIVAGVVLEALL